MALRSTALTLLALLALPALPAAAEETKPQKLFRERLLADRGVSKDVKQALRGGGFVDRKIRFGDLTGDTRDDALVTVNQGGSAGRIALYVYSSHGSRSGRGGSANPLQIVYKHQRLYRARVSLKRPGRKRPLGGVIYREPIFDPGDELADPGAWRRVELRWRSKRSRFRRAATEVIDNVDSRYCSRTGDFCTRTTKDERGRVYLELTTPSFTGRYFLCVTPPTRSAADCQAFTLRRSGDAFVSRVRWITNFPDEGRGRYGVTWRLGGTQLGPELGFRSEK